MSIGDELDAIVEACQGCILGTGPRRGTDGKVLRHADGGEWDPVRALPPRVLRGLVALGMAGRMRPMGATLPDRLRGVPSSPDELAHMISARGHGPAELDPAQAVEWYVGRVMAARAVARGDDIDRARPEPDPLPAWVDAWLGRMVCDTKRAYALEAARSVYWGDDGYPAPDELGRPWENAIWRKLGNRHCAEHTRAALAHNPNRMDT